MLFDGQSTSVNLSDLALDSERSKLFDSSRGEMSLEFALVNIEWKKFNIKLEISPTLLENEEVLLEVNINGNKKFVRLSRGEEVRLTKRENISLRPSTKFIDITDSVSSEIVADLEQLNLLSILFSNGKLSLKSDIGKLQIIGGA